MTDKGIVSEINEIWVQALYGSQWEDLEEVYDIIQADQIIGTLKSKRPEGSFRRIKKSVIERVI